MLGEDGLWYSVNISGQYRNKSTFGGPKGETVFPSSRTFVMLQLLTDLSNADHFCVVDGVQCRDPKAEKSRPLSEYVQLTDTQTSTGTSGL